MLNRHCGERNEILLLSEVARAVGRAGLAMTGGDMCHVVDAQLATVNCVLLDSVEFLVWMILLGMVAFYLGIDIPRQRLLHRAIERSGVDQIELLSAAGTFLAALCALISMYAFVFDEDLRQGWDVIVGSAWMLGIIMLISAGLIGRWRFRSTVRGTLRAQPASASPHELRAGLAVPRLVAQPSDNGTVCPA